MQSVKSWCLHKLKERTSRSALCRCESFLHHLCLLTDCAVCSSQALQAWTHCIFTHASSAPGCVLWPLLQVITRILQSSSAFVKLRATDVLLSALAHDPLPLRSFLAGQAGHQLLDCLVTEFISSEQSGLPEQIAELLKLLVDPGGRGDGF